MSEAIYVISRHKSTIDYIIDRFGRNKDVVILEHLKDASEIPEGSEVFGNLPIEMIAKLIERGCVFHVVSLEIPKELRGKELGIDEIRKYAKIIRIDELKISYV